MRTIGRSVLGIHGWLAALALAGCAYSQGSEGNKRPSGTGVSISPAAMPSFTNLQARVDQFAVAELTANIADLPESEKKALKAVIEAARLLDPVFDRQAWAGNPSLAKTLAKDASPEGQAQYAYFRIMRGPWDRQNDFEPFAINRQRPPGAGYYPEDLSETVFKQWLQAHPEDRETFQSLYTIIERDGDALVAKPYREVFAPWLKPAAKQLRTAATLTQNPSLRAFLNARATAFETDDYRPSERLWMDLDSRVEITIGPYETYEDGLLGLKAAFEAFVTISDPDASARLEKFKSYLRAMEQNLPVPDAMKTKRGDQSPIRVVDLVFSAGDARKSVQTVAFNLPNDEQVRADKGAKKVLLRNSIRTKFDQILRPIATRILDPGLVDHLSADAFFHQVLSHELSHSLGPAFVNQGGKQVEVRLALGPVYTALEECKADAMGAYNILFMIEQGEFPPQFRKPLLVSYFAGLFRSARFGINEAHGKSATIQINRYLEAGAATYDPLRRVFSLDTEALAAEITKLVRDLVTLQHRGERDAAERFAARYGVASAPIASALRRLKGLPMDIRPVYPLAGERIEDRLTQNAP